MASSTSRRSWAGSLTIIHPYRQRILGHILVLPFRTLPVTKHMENMSAMTFLLLSCLRTATSFSAFGTRRLGSPTPTTVLSGTDQPGESGALLPLIDNDVIVKPVHRQLYLNELIDDVVKTEHALMSASPSPFSEAMGKYLNRYPQEMAENFLTKLEDPRYVRTLRNVILFNYAPALIAELERRMAEIIASCFTEENRS
ncbi:hypothetical protein EXIGLDRAFT_761961 [Exidia glandulosa HHB12029]|uniref:Uncharacterized protein n=1 Tax=Exidia glandulosa HHB12029 TaxID=1314781 RepID=A0A165N214_EXIGL|nr:hypothetical protein EXIGLDRAFT_761961 [Exidia glandulosa HHB12029]